MTKRLFRVAVDAAADAADDIKKPIQMVVEAASDKKAKEAALTAISQNAETSARTRGKVVVDVEEFNKQPVTEKFQVASPQEVRKVTAAAAGKKSGEMGEAIIQPHKLTVDDVEYDLPAFDPKDPKYQVMGMRSATGEDLFRLGQANMKPQNLTIFPNSWEMALSNDANPKMRSLGKWLGVSDDMDKGVAGWANNGGLIGRAVNTSLKTGAVALATEMGTSVVDGPDFKGRQKGDRLVGDGWVSQGFEGSWDGAKAAANLILGGKTEKEKLAEGESAKKQKIQESKENKAFSAVLRMSPAGQFSKQAIDNNTQTIARVIGDKSENGSMAHRTYEEAIRPFFNTAQGENDEDRISNAARAMFQRQSADQIVEALLFGSAKAEKDVHAARSQRQTAEGVRPEEFKPSAQDAFDKYLKKVQKDDPNTPYITFPSSMTSSSKDGVRRTGFMVTRALPDGTGEKVFVVPVIVPKKTLAEQTLQGTKAAKGDSDVPKLSDRMSENRFEVIYLDANPRNPKKPEIPADQIIW